VTSRTIETAPAEQGTLYVVATPIGNLEDITLRALRILREVELILAEDTRVTRKLLSKYDIHTHLAAYHGHSDAAQAARFVKRLLEGTSMALVSDAGTPAISDPGDQLIEAAVNAGVPVVPIPGPSAVIAAVSISAVPGGRFAFDGFPPRGRSDRVAFFSAMRRESRTVVLYEAPQRLLATLRDLHGHLGQRHIVVARELTKRFEDVFRGLLTEAITQFERTEPRGEFTLVIHPPHVDVNVPPDLEDIRRRIDEAAAAGLSPAEAARTVAAATGASRRDVYRMLTEAKRHGG
jgi:16S rRNA (cytidine1402-2'-O)-methyltransferase